MTTIGRLSKRYPRALLETLIYLPDLKEAQLTQKEFMLNATKEMEALLNTDHSETGVYKVELEEDTEKHYWLPKLTITHHGADHKLVISRDLFASSEYHQMIEFGAKMKDFIHSGAYIKRGDKQRNIVSFAEAVAWLIDEAKKGQTIQRYKGLGEMNPDQLWDTTMNPETRRMLQVTIEDAVSADKIFTTLMGDQVEPRRDFIEMNALDVVNLDI
jgi:DNA gyrase subunit B